jgi:predicted nucleotidyltransferase component of viral defense system
MSLFDDLVDSALQQRPELGSLRPVVEKEILHHEILRITNRSGMLRNLVFIGGTCLRLCHGSLRLSEDLDFATSLQGGSLTSELEHLGRVLVEELVEKYDLPVRVHPPVRTDADVHTWKVRVTTRPERRDLPQQRVHIDVQTLPAHDAVPLVLRNPYRVDLGTMGLIVAAASLSEILADKIIAVALRPNRVKNRDLWDIGWLDQQSVTFQRNLLLAKLADRSFGVEEFRERYTARCRELEDGRDDFLFEMRRFLPQQVMQESTSSPGYWDYLVRTVRSFGDRL